jgi:hypothetical protein
VSIWQESEVIAMDASSIDCCYTTLQKMPHKGLVWRKDATARIGFKDENSRMPDAVKAIVMQAKVGRKACCHGRQVSVPVGLVARRYRLRDGDRRDN